jgi:Protein of unknown function (DUF2892)
MFSNLVVQSMFWFFSAFAVGFAYRAVTRKLVKPRAVVGRAKNIGKIDRLLRVAIGVALLLWATATSWNPTLLFLSGFAFFESIFSWCAFYQLTGKNSCPIK